ncbi:MAG: FHA domain-containing protein [Planctomycetota bacterium]|nr:FHA domain-containing protein [Planctomycetota bacterium]
MARLIFRSGLLEGRTVELPSGKALVIGRARDVDLCVPDIKLSRRHCRIESGMAGVVIHDMGSTNGTYVNGRRVEGEAVLAKGDQITFGDSTVEVVLEESIADIPTHALPAQDIAKAYDPIAEIDLPLPPLPEVSPAVQAAQPKKKSSLEGLSFCDGCDVSIPVLDLEIGLAGEVGGRLLCKDCIAKRSGAPAAPVPAGVSPLEEIEPAGGTGPAPDLLAALEEADDGDALDPLKLMGPQHVPAAGRGDPARAAAQLPAGSGSPPRAAAERPRKDDTLSRLKAQLMAEARGEVERPGGSGAPSKASRPAVAPSPAGEGSGVAPVARPVPAGADEDLVPLGEAIGSAVPEMDIPVSPGIAPLSTMAKPEAANDDLVPLAEVPPQAGPQAAQPPAAFQAATEAPGQPAKPSPSQALDEDLVELEPIEEPDGSEDSKPGGGANPGGGKDG